MPCPLCPAMPALPHLEISEAIASVSVCPQRSQCVCLCVPPAPAPSGTQAMTVALLAQTHRPGRGVAAFRAWSESGPWAGGPGPAWPARMSAP